MTVRRPLQVCDVTVPITRKFKSIFWGRYTFTEKMKTQQPLKVARCIYVSLYVLQCKPTHYFILFHTQLLKSTRISKYWNIWWNKKLKGDNYHSPLHITAMRKQAINYLIARKLLLFPYMREVTSLRIKNKRKKHNMSILLLKLETFVSLSKSDNVFFFVLDHNNEY